MEWADHSSGFTCNADNVYYVNNKVMLAQAETLTVGACNPPLSGLIMIHKVRAETRWTLSTGGPHLIPGER